MADEVPPTGGGTARAPSQPAGSAAASGAAIEALAVALGDRVRRGVPLAERTTYRVGGVAALLTEVGSVADLEVLSRALQVTPVPVLVVGRGSNLLVADAGFAGLVVVLDAGWDDIAIDGTDVRAGAAAALPVVARRTAAAGLSGFEWAVGVPGSMGGAVRMNAGGHGSDMAASVVGVRVFDLRSGEDVVMSASQLAFGYRTSALTSDQVVVSVDLGLVACDRHDAERIITDIVAWRRANQPGGANAGSVFTNPPGDSAGRLIDEAGLKGVRVGTAEVSPKHANFIQVDAGGSADDVAALMDLVVRTVMETTGVQLVAETRMVGFIGTPGGPAREAGS